MILDRVEKCMDRIAKLIGLNAPDLVIDNEYKFLGKLLEQYKEERKTESPKKISENRA